MASTLELVRKRGSMHERLIVALDVDDLEHGQRVVGFSPAKWYV